jgi:hypothetical protein
LPAFWPGGLRPPVVLDPRTPPGQPRGGPSFIRRGGEKEGKREREELLLPLQGELHRLEGKRKRTSRPLPFLFKEKEKPSASRFAVLKERGGGRRKGPRGSCLFRGTPDLLVDLEEIASFRMRE